MCPIFVIKFSGVSDLQGVKIPVFPLTLLVIVTTVLRYRAACDVGAAAVQMLTVNWTVIQFLHRETWRQQPGGLATLAEAIGKWCYHSVNSCHWHITNADPFIAFKRKIVLFNCRNFLCTCRAGSVQICSHLTRIWISTATVKAGSVWYVSLEVFFVNVSWNLGKGLWTYSDAMIEWCTSNRYHFHVS